MVPKTFLELFLLFVLKKERDGKKANVHGTEDSGEISIREIG